MSEVQKTDSSEENQEQKFKQPLLKDITKQSWNLELLISGVAIYFSLGLPVYIERLYDYYRISFTSSEETNFFPLLIYGFFQSFALILIISFVVHFILRAFWVGMIGLLAVFPQGIQYDKLPQSNYAKEELKKRMGTFEDFIDQLDKTCSIILSVAFTVVVISVGISLIYFNFFLITESARYFLDEDDYKYFIIGFLGIFFTVIMTFAIIVSILKLKKFKDNPKYEKLQFRLLFINQQVFLPIINRPFFYLSSMYSSNISKTRYYTWVFVVLTLIMINIFVTLARKANKDVFDLRNYYSTNSENHKIGNQYYENLRDKNLIIQQPVINSDVIEGRYLKIFIPYLKEIDGKLEQLCGESPTDTTKSRRERRRKTDSTSLKCIEKYFKIYVNEIPYQPEFFFHQNLEGGEKGFLVYLPSDEFEIGLNKLEIKKSIFDKEKESEIYVVIPFYYFYEKNR